MPARNNAELTAMLMPIASNVIKSASLDMIEMLANDIMEYTYEFGGLPNAYYYNGSGMPTFQFLEAFKLTDIEKNMNQAATKIFYDWAGMDYDPTTYLHGNPFSGDVREQLADILNIDGEAGWMTKARKPYWDIFIKQILDDGGAEKLFDRYMSEEFGKIGIRVVRG